MKDSNDRYRQIGQKIKEAREEAGLSQRELAEKAGFETPTAITLIEAGERKVAVDVLEKIATILGKELNYFLGKDTKKHDARIALRSVEGVSEKDKEILLRLLDLAQDAGNKDGNTRK